MARTRAPRLARKRPLFGLRKRRARERRPKAERWRSSAHLDPQTRRASGPPKHDARPRVLPVAILPHSGAPFRTKLCVGSRLPGRDPSALPFRRAGRFPSDPRGRRSLTVRHPGVQLTGGGIFDEIVSSEPSASSGCQAFGLLGAAPEGRAPLDSAAVSGHPKRQHQGGAARLSHRHRQVSGCAERHSRRRRSRLDVLVEMEDVVWVVPAFQRDQPVVLGSPVDLRTGGVRFDDLVDVSAR